MASTPGGSTNNGPMKPNLSVYTKNHSARKPLCEFSGTMDVKHKTDINRLGADKSNHKAIKTGNALC